MADIAPCDSLHDYLKASVCSKDVIEQFLRNGVSINSRGIYDTTPLHHAVTNENCSLEIIKYLLDIGADISMGDVDGETPLHYLVQKFRKDAMDVACLLLDCGSEVDEVDGNGCTTLHHAVQTRHNKDIVKFLIDRGANIHALCCLSLSTLQYAAHDHRQSTVNEEGELIYTSDGDYNIIKLLINRGAGVNYRNKYGCDALHYAAPWCNPRIIRLLINHGAQMNVLDILGRSPLYMSLDSIRSNREVSKMLLDCGAFVSCGKSPLKRAIKKYNSDKDKANLGNLQLLLKYAFFENAALDTAYLEEQYADSCIPEELINYKSECLREIRAMQLISVDNITLVQFVFELREDLHHKEEDDINRILYELMHIVYSNAFPLYNEVIGGVIDREHFKDYLENVVVYAVSSDQIDPSTGCLKKVVLPIAAIHSLTSYFSDPILLNFTSAFYDSFNS